MRNVLRLVVAATLLAPALGLAQASVQLRLDLPVVLPQMVVVSPGVQVVPDVDEEVFFYNGWYWVRRDDGWYRSHSHRRGWYFVQPERVPRRLVGLPPGQYRRWHPPPPAPRPGYYRPAPVRYSPAPVRYSPAPPPRPEPAHEGHGPPPRGEGYHGHDKGEGHDRDRHDNGRHGDHD